MGRFYKASGPSFAQGMIADLDTDLMLGTLKVHDDAFDEVNSEGGELSKLLAEVENIKIDNEVVNAEKANFNERISGLQSKIENDPANYMKYQSEMRNISRDLSGSLDNGIFKRASDRKVKEEETFTKYDAVEGASSGSKDGMKQVNKKRDALNNGLNWQGENKYNEYASTMPYDNVFAEYDTQGYFKSVRENLTPDQIAKADAWASNGYLNTSSGTTKSVDIIQVETVLEDHLNNSQWEEKERQRVWMKLENDSANADKIFDPNGDEVQAIVDINKKKFLESAIATLSYSQDTKKRGKSSDATELQGRRFEKMDEKNAVPDVNILTTSDNDVKTHEKQTMDTNVLNYLNANKKAGVHGIKTEMDLFNSVDSYMTDNPAINVVAALEHFGFSHDDANKMGYAYGKQQNVNQGNYYSDEDLTDQWAKEYGVNVVPSATQMTAYKNKKNRELETTYSATSTSKRYDNIEITVDGNATPHNDMSIEEIYAEDDTGGLGFDIFSADYTVSTGSVPATTEIRGGGNAYMVNGSPAVNSEGTPLSLEQITSNGYTPDMEDTQVSVKTFLEQQDKISTNLSTTKRVGEAAVLENTTDFVVNGPQGEMKVTLTTQESTGKIE